MNKPVYLLLLTFIYFPSFAQRLVTPFPLLSTTQTSIYYLNNSLSLSLNQNLSGRYDSYSYKPVVFGNTQIISMNRSDLNQDMVYFIDAKGNTQYVTYGVTNPVNINKYSVPKDSFNPYGASDPWEGLATGILNGLINGTLWKPMAK